MASSLAVLATAFTPTERPEVLQDRFGCRGVQFKRQSGGMLMLHLKLHCGTKTQIAVPNATVTSYKPIMWHETAEEMLHVPNPYSQSSAPGGISPSFVLLDGESEAQQQQQQQLDLHWMVQDVAMNWHKSAKVVLNAGYGNLTFTYTLNLSKDDLSMEASVKNLDNVPAAFKASIQTQLSVAEIAGCYIVGLLGNKYLSLAPPSTTPTSGGASQHAKRGPHILSGLAKLLGGRAFEDENQDDERLIGRDGEVWFVQGQDMGSIPPGMDRLYAISSRLWPILDRGKRRTLRFGKEGFVYYRISNPGPASKFSDWGQVVTVGPTTGDKSICLQPGQEWTGAQVLNNSQGSL